MVKESKDQNKTYIYIYNYYCFIILLLYGTAEWVSLYLTTLKSYGLSSISENLGLLASWHNKKEERNILLKIGDAAHLVGELGDLDDMEVLIQLVDLFQILLLHL